MYILAVGKVTNGKVIFTKGRRGNMAEVATIRRCKNCKYGDQSPGMYPCCGCGGDLGDRWEPKEEIDEENGQL